MTVFNNATTRRLRRASDLGAKILNRFAAGDRLVARFLIGHPADLWVDGDDWRLRLYGFETPACRSETAAIIAWARMATEPDTSLSAPSERANSPRRRDLLPAASGAFLKRPGDSA